MSMSKTLRICALGSCASLFSLFSMGCGDDPERASTAIDPSKADPGFLDGALPRPSGAGAGNRTGSDDPEPALDAGLGERAPPPADAGSDAALRVPGPGDFLGFDAALALRATP